ncbi:MAG: hypothetical protein ACLUTF_09110 [Anaerostipes hadrus]
MDQNGKYLYSKIRFEKDENGKKEMLYGVLNKRKDWFQYGLKENIRLFTICQKSERQQHKNEQFTTLRAKRTLKHCEDWD